MNNWCSGIDRNYIHLIQIDLTKSSFGKFLCVLLWKLSSVFVTSSTIQPVKQTAQIKPVGSRRSMTIVTDSARDTCQVFFTDTLRAPSMQRYTHIGVGQNEINYNCAIHMLCLCTGVCPNFCCVADEGGQELCLLLDYSIRPVFFPFAVVSLFQFELINFTAIQKMFNILVISMTTILIKYLFNSQLFKMHSFPTSSFELPPEQFHTLHNRCSHSRYPLM